MRTSIITLQLLICVFLVSCSRIPLKVQERFLYQEKYPLPGQEVNISYCPSGTILEDATKIKLVAYCFSEGFPITEEILMEKSGGIWQGSFTITDSALAVYIIFKSEFDQDDNDKNAYKIPLYTADKNPVKGSMMRQAEVAFYGGPYPFLQSDWEKARNYLVNEFNFYPEHIKNKGIINSYWFPYNDLHRDSASQIIKVQLQKLDQKKEKTIDELSLLINWHKELNNKELAEKYKNELSGRIQNVGYGEIDRFKECAIEKSVERKQDLILSFIEDFPNSIYIEQLHDQMISTYNEKELYAEAENYYNTYVRDSTTGFFYDPSWAMYKGKIILEKFVDFAEIEVEKARMELGTKEKPDHYTKKEWQEKQNQDLVDALDTYGFGLYTLGKFEESVPVLEEAVELDQRKDKIIHESYCRALYETGRIDKAFTELELMVWEDPWNQELQILFEEVYVRQKGNKYGLESFLVEAHKAQRAMMEEKTLGQMMAIPAPPFALKDLDGNTIRLTDYRGKIVILYFWATWCRPCIAGFPTMQKSVYKYKDDDMVKFLFIDVLERGDSAKKRAKDLISKNKYTFHVLFDEDSCSVTSAYKVSGIPTKFFVDQEGIIRFGGKKRPGYEMETIEDTDIKIEILRNLHDM